MRNLMLWRAEKTIRKLVYKPRSLEIDVAWEEFLAHFKTERSSVKAPHAVNFGDYGFIEYIEHKPTLMIPVARYFGKGGKDDPEDEESRKKNDSLEALNDRSVIKMGFLPLWHKDGENKRADYGARTGDKPDMANLPVYEGKRYPGNESGLRKFASISFNRIT